MGSTQSTRQRIGFPNDFLTGTYTVIGTLGTRYSLFISLWLVNAVAVLLSARSDGGKGGVFILRSHRMRRPYAKVIDFADAVLYGVFPRRRIETTPFGGTPWMPCGYFPQHPENF